LPERSSAFRFPEFYFPCSRADERRQPLLIEPYNVRCTRQGAAVAAASPLHFIDALQVS
jgi:hypothetical protein